MEYVASIRGAGAWIAPNLGQPDMTFRVNRNVWFAVFSYANEFPEGGVAVNLDGGSS